MILFKQLAAVFVAASMILPPAPLLAGTKKGDKLRNQARVEEVKGNLEHAFQLTQQAVAEDAGDPAYTLQMNRIRFELGVQDINKARKLREAGKLAEALAEFQKAYDTDPASDIAGQEIRITKEMIDRVNNGGKTGGMASKSDTSSLTPAEFARKEQQDLTNALMPVPRLRPLSNDPINLKLVNRPRTLFETLAKVAGINVVFDPDYNTQQTITQPVQIDLSNTTLESALDEISLVTKSFWKPLAGGTTGESNSIFVSVDNRNNRTLFTDQVVKVFYLSNPTTPQEIQEMLTVLRTVFDVQKVFNYTSQNALVVRCDADTMALVEKEIADLDKPRNEVIVDVMVMQVSSTYSRQTGAGIGGSGLNISGGFAPRASIQTPVSPNSTSAATTSTTTTTTATGITPTTNSDGTTTTPGASIPFSQLGHISTADYSISNLPGATFEAMLSDSTTRVLQSPQVRCAQSAKCSVKIGEKIPIATGSFQSAVGAVGALPAANTQFSFQDVGVTLEINPQIHDNSEVSLHLDLDVSQVLDRINVGGVSQPEIAENKVTADIRLREGEVNLIGGIIQDTNTKSLAGIPGLARIPLLGRLFSNEDLDKNKTELVIALVPHIVRGPDITASNLRGVMSGSSGQIKVSYDTTKLVQDGIATAPPAGAINAAASVGSAVPATSPVITPAIVNSPPPTAPPATAPPATAPPATAPPATAPPATAPPATAPPATAPPARIGLGVPGVSVPVMGMPNAVSAGTSAETEPSTGGPARVALQPAISTATLNSAVTMTINAENVVNLADVTAQLQYDPKILRVANIVAGELPGRNSAPLEVSKTILDDAGRADMRMSRGPNGGTISGSGSLFTVVFQAIGRGNTSVTLNSVGIRNAMGPVAATTPAPASVNVQ
jgi:general secretion pathway protein D